MALKSAASRCIQDLRVFQHLLCEGQWAGLALVRTAGINDMAEFFVLRKYRRRGVGRDAARQVFAMFPGPWQVRQLHGNDAATAFWRSVIPDGYTESFTEAGPVQRFNAS